MLLTLNFQTKLLTRTSGLSFSLSSKNCHRRCEILVDFKAFESLRLEVHRFCGVKADFVKLLLNLSLSRCDVGRLNFKFV